MKISSLKHYSIAALAAAFAIGMLIVPGHANAQSAPTGVTEGLASQLIAWYDQEETDIALGGWSLFQVTNASDSTPVSIHVQIFADDIFTTDRCREHDFSDTLTPNDTIVYNMGSLDEPFDDPVTPDVFTRGGNNAHAPIAIDVGNTRGFIVVTAVNQTTLPRQAISHNFLHGSMFIISFDNLGMSFPAMGREAVSASGALATQGVLLDGVANSLRLLQPNMLYQSFNNWFFDESANVVSIAFTDDYSDVNGEYRAQAATATWDTLMYDVFEEATSCHQHVNTCFVSLGLNDDIDNASPPFTGNGNDFRLCPAVNDDSVQFDGGWFRIEVSGLGGSVNNLGILGLSTGTSRGLASWMQGE